METRLQDLKSKLEIGSGGVHMVGILGVGGGSKTTLACAAYMEISHQFEACCLLENIREESSKHGLKRLQEKFLSLALKTNKEVGSEIEGRSMIKQELCRKRVLVILDDVDEVKQINALAGAHDWFGDGSRVIITTRDEHLLTRHTDAIYEVSLLSHDEAIKLFSRHAYQKDKPVEDYEMLSQDVVSYAGGLPLALEILGSFLYDKDKDEWMSALAKLKCIPNFKVMERLKISYDGLEYHEKELFLDIVCFLRRWPIEQAQRVLDACSFHRVIGVKVLVQKSLIKISNGKFDMHDLVEEMAHYIVRGEPPYRPEKQSRIWQEEDILELCAMWDEASKENNHIEVLALPSQAPCQVLKKLPRVDAKRLRIEKTSMSSSVSHPHLPDVVANMKKLRWLYLEGYPASSFPSNFQPTKLGCLMLINSRQKELWQGRKDLPNLKILDLSCSFHLTRTPDFNGLPCLERLILVACGNLEEIHPSVGHHERLVSVNMIGCSKVKTFPPIKKMKKLETLELSSCYQLQKFPDIQTTMDSLANLHLKRTAIEIIPALVGEFCTNLVSFDISYCKKLQKIEGSFHLLKSLKVVNLDDCFQLQNFPWDSFDKECCLEVLSMYGIGCDSTSFVVLPQFPRFLRELNLSKCKLRDGTIPTNICELVNLQVLDLSFIGFSRLPSSLSRMRCLKFLNLSCCKKLVELPDLPSSIAILEANYCWSLESVGDFSNYKRLWKVSLRRLNKLIGSGRVLRSMLQVNAVEDRLMSFILPKPFMEDKSLSDTRTFTLQLPDNWYNDFSGFILCVDYFQVGEYSIAINQEMSTDCQPVHDHWEVFDKTWESYEYAQVGYVPFSSLRHAMLWNSTYTNITFHSHAAANPKVGLVPRKSKLGDPRERPIINSSDCWGEEYRFTKFWSEEHQRAKTFEIVDDLKSSGIKIAWKHSY